MKRFELTYLALEPFLPPLIKTVRKRLVIIAKASPYRLEILDVGGRKSHQTINVPANITITDLPRESSIQKELNLGINDSIIEQTYSRRTNVKSVLFDDMTRSALPDQAFDCVVATEVLEHVEEDGQFVKEVWRVLKPRGIFLMTTPNGDSVKNTNPDHKRHYTREHLRSLLGSVFDDVAVEYAIQGGLFRRLGLKSWSVRKPVQTGLSMFSNLVNTMQSSRAAVKNQAVGTRHLVAIASKQS
jgi:SAM-dependent methyltransferase